ncbi:MAG: hypothetical protein AAGC97_13360 [Planctomycetota bacterium]
MEPVNPYQSRALNQDTATDSGQVHWRELKRAAKGMMTVLGGVVILEFAIAICFTLVLLMMVSRWSPSPKGTVFLNLFLLPIAGVPAGWVVMLVGQALSCRLSQVERAGGHARSSLVLHGIAIGCLVTVILVSSLDSVLFGATVVMVESTGWILGLLSIAIVVCVMASMAMYLLFLRAIACHLQADDLENRANVTLRVLGIVAFMLVLFAGISTVGLGGTLGVGSDASILLIPILGIVLIAVSVGTVIRVHRLIWAMCRRIRLGPPESYGLETFPTNSSALVEE